MTNRHILLAGVAMTAIERAQGRYLRAEEGHTPAPTPAAAPAPTPAATTIKQVGGVERVQVSGDQAGQEAREAQAANPQPKGEEGKRPEGLPEGFDTLEAFVAAVNDGTYKPGEAQAADPKAAAQEPPAVDDPRLVPYTEELSTKGELSPESVTKAAKEFGVSEEMVRTYVSGLSSAQAVLMADFHAVAGSPDDYAAFAEWAPTGLTEAQLNAYNKSLDADPDTAKVLLAQYVGAWKAAGGGPGPRDLSKDGQGGGGGQEAGDVYASWAQVTEAMRDKRYTGEGGRKDPAYIKSVEEKLGRSNLT